MNYNGHLTAGLATAWDCKPGEVEARVASKRKRLSQESTHHDIPWTAARCNRLLRTITSRINLLQNDLKNGQLRTQTAITKGNRKSQIPATSGRPAIPRGDPEWLPDLQTKAQVRTYGTNACSQRKTSKLAKSNPFATPFVKRLMKPTFTHSPKDVPALPQFRPHERKQLPVQSQSSSEESLKNLVAAFGNLLVATNPVSPPKRRGARSLRSSCLRKIPEYIVLEAALPGEVDADTEDVASSIYADLETFGTRAGGGWSGLREVVRAHAVQQVCGAIVGRLLPDDRAAQIFDMCNRHGAIPEAFDVAQSWLTRQEASGVSLKGTSHPAWLKLHELDTSHGTLERSMRMRAWLVQAGGLAVNDALMPSDLGADNLISALVRGPGQCAAWAYLEATVSRISTPDAIEVGDPGQRLLERIAGLLVSICFARSTEDADTSMLSYPVAAFHRIAVEVVLSQSRGLGDHRTQSVTVRRFLQASLLLRMANVPIDQNLSTIGVSTLMALLGCNTTTSAVGRRPRNDFVQFACNVAKHFARFADLTAAEALKRMTSGLENIMTSASSTNRQALQEIEVDIAFTFAEQAGTKVSNAIMARIGGANPQQAADVQQALSKSDTATSFRWEEGICEWIAATPLRKIIDRYPTPQSDSEDYSCTPAKKTYPRPAATITRTPKRPRPARTSVEVDICSPDILNHMPSSHNRPRLSSARSLRTTKALSQRSPKLVDPAKPVKFDAELRLGRVEVSSKTEASKLLKRTRNNSAIRTKNADSAPLVPDDLADELGRISPVLKRVRLSISDLPTKTTTPLGDARKSLVARPRISLPARIAAPEDESDDELGL